MNKLKTSFEKRNINVLYFETFNEAKKYLIEAIPADASIGIGHSQTLKHMDITRCFKRRGHTVFDKELGQTPTDKIKIKKDALLSDCYISSSNAVSLDGRIVNIDHSGNRVAALSFGPDKVYLVIGKNKITETFTDAIQ